MNNDNDKNNNLTKHALLVLSKFYSLLCVCKKKKKKKKKKEKSLPSAKKIADKIIASFLIIFCRGLIKCKFVYS